MKNYYIDHELAVLAQLHQDANKPDEPYCGVAALFNADLHATEPEYAPRGDWTVLSPYEIELEIIKDRS